MRVSIRQPMGDQAKEGRPGRLSKGLAQYLAEQYTPWLSAVPGVRQRLPLSDSLCSAEAGPFDGHRRGERGATWMPCYCCCKAMEGLECARRFRRHSARTLLLGAFVRVVHNGTGWIAPQTETLSSSDELSFDERGSFLARNRVSREASSADASADASGVSQCALGGSQSVSGGSQSASGGSQSASGGSQPPSGASRVNGPETTASEGGGVLPTLVRFCRGRTV